MLQADKLVAAIFQLLVGGLLHIKKCLEIVKFSSFILNFLYLNIVLADSFISLVNDVLVSIGDVVWQGSLEFLSKLGDLDLKFSKSILDVCRFFILERKNLLFYWSKGFLRNVNEAGFAVLKFDQIVCVHLKLMFFKKSDNLFHWLDLIEGSIFDHFDISKVGHDSHEEFFV